MAPNPTQIGPYRVLAVLGTGDFAQVYRVKKARTQHEFALKIAREDSTAARLRLRLEAEALKGLNHATIPKFVEADVFEQRPYVVMELAPGQPLRAEFKRRGDLGAVFGDIEALRLLTVLLEGLAHVHSKGHVHRDIKDANLVVDLATSELRIIDFGFCKVDGKDEIRHGDSFFRAGAVRYSPPSKIARPEHAVANHDVFAAGVIGYQMLTGMHPWSVDQDEGLGAFREAHQRPAVPLFELNSRVDRSIGQFVMALLERDDARRPESHVAATEAARILRAASTRRTSSKASTALSVQFPRVIRDSLHGDVRLTDYEWEILGTPEMQRLRWIRQLGLSHLVYPGAEHSRLSHSLGSVFRVEQILRSIEDIESVRMDPETRLVARLYALVHDVTHVAFGHTVEDELGLFERHDKNSQRTDRLLVGSSLGEKLREDSIGAAVLSHFDVDATIQARSSVRDLVSSSTGADVLDYIDRDALHCGLVHRVDSAIFRQFRLAPLHNEASDARLVSLLYGAHGVRLDREFAVQSLLNERYALFLKVYTHRAKIAACALLGKGLVSTTNAAEDNGIAEPKYEWMSDVAVLEHLRHSSSSVARDVAERLYRRDLPRAVYRANLLSDSEPSDDDYHARRADLKARKLLSAEGRAQVEAELGNLAGLEQHHVIVYCPANAPGYQRVEHWLSSKPGSASEVDPIKKPYLSVRARHLALWELWIFSTGDPKKDSRLEGAASERFGFENRIAADRRAERLL